ncbi:hypothetical protein KQ298_09710 [Synechococcus sp. CS-1330]|nr:hypothetical protein [Synechococcus sp. CS-1330]
MNNDIGEVAADIDSVKALSAKDRRSYSGKNIYGVCSSVPVKNGIAQICKECVVALTAKNGAAGNQGQINQVVSGIAVD